jgi:hypothetical protein
LPAFKFFKARNYTSFWIAVVLGFAIGGVTWLVFKILFALSLGNDLSFSWRQASNADSWVLATGALGSVVGATLWLIARPDRR